MTLSAAAFAQTPEPKKEGGALARTFSWNIDGNTGYLGIQTSDVTKENYASLGLTEVRGVAVEKVLEGSPALTAGLQDGDVILRFNGEEVTSARKLTRLVSEVAPDHKSRLTVFRDGREREITVTVGKRPAPQFDNGGFTFKFPDDGEAPGAPFMPPLAEIPRMKIAPMSPVGPGNFVFSIGGAGRRIGVSLTPLTEQLAKHFGVSSGVLITEVRPDSPAAKAGLTAGDIITEADGKAVRNDADLIRAIGGKKDGDLSLTVVRGGTTQKINVTPEDSRDDLQKIFELRREGPARIVRPAPLPLNQLLVPGRVI